MRQQQRSVQAVRPGPPEVLPLPTTVEDPTARVRVIAGADVQDLQVVGQTVGQARAVAEAVMGINANAHALVDGREVSDAHVLVAGQQLEFTKHAGQKGALSAGTRRDPPPGAVIDVAEDRVTWRRDGEPLGSTTLGNLLARIAATGQGRQSWRLYPRHVRLMVERNAGSITAVVIEMPPGPRRVRWISDDARHPYGADAGFEDRRLSFPWIVLVIVFTGGELSGFQQAFYRTTPIGSLNDKLYYTNLLNVAEGYGQESWVCLVNLQRRLARLSWDQRIRSVTDHFWQAAFNRSSEVNEGNSYWGTMRGMDSRFESAASWEAATVENPYFALEVSWRRAKHTLGDTLDQMLNMVAPWRPIERVEHLVTIMQQGDR